MKFTNEGRKPVTFSMAYEGSNEPFQHQTVDPGKSTTFTVGNNANAAEITVTGGLLFSGEDKEFSSLELRSMRNKLEQALLKVRSGEAKEAIEDVIYRLGY